eukprot:s2681_g16.t1
MLLETMLAACLLPAAPLQERATGVNQATLLAKPEYDQILDGSRDLAFSSSVDSGRRVSHNMTHEIEEQARRISDVALSQDLFLRERCLARVGIFRESTIPKNIHRMCPPEPVESLCCYADSIANFAHLVALSKSTFYIYETLHVFKSAIPSRIYGGSQASPTRTTRRRYPGKEDYDYVFYLT